MLLLLITTLSIATVTSGKNFKDVKVKFVLQLFDFLKAVMMKIGLKPRQIMTTALLLLINNYNHSMISNQKFVGK